MCSTRRKKWAWEIDVWKFHLTRCEPYGYASARALLEGMTDVAFGFMGDTVGRDGDAVVCARALRSPLTPKQILAGLK